MEKVKNEVKKAVLRKDRLTVVYTEHLPEANYTNTINKSCDQIVHSDLKEAMSKLKAHLVFLCEQPEAVRITAESIKSPGFAETFPNYVITGFSHDSTDGVPGVTIFGQKMLQSGKVVDLKIFVPLCDESYPFSQELSIDTQAINWEVEEYLFSEKWGIRQERLDFESDEPIEADLDDKPRKRGRRKKEIAEDVAIFDATA